MCWFRCTQSPISLLEFLKSIWGKETYIRSHPSRVHEKANSACTCRMNYIFGECGKLHNETAEWLTHFFPLAPTKPSFCITFTFPTSFSTRSLSLHNQHYILEQIDILIQGWVDIVYTLLSFGCSLDEFFIQNKIMKTIRSLSTKSSVTLAVLLQSISFHQSWSQSLLQ